FQQISVHTFVGFFVNVTSSAGTLPGLVIKLQHSPDSITWFDIPNTSSNTLATTGSYNLSPSAVQNIGDFVRCAWTISGVNASFTFNVQLTVVG
ncbi:MAG: hypothetical protein ACREBJ_05665, partial [Nitrosotalea sp.]